MKRVLSPTNFPKPSLIRRKMHLISVDDLTDDFVDSVLKKSDEMRTLVKTHGGDNRLNNKLLTLPFFEASTRTNCSFQAAILRLGGKVVPVNEKSSSSKKGESLEDTIRTLSCYSDIIVIRHPEKGSSLQASLVSNVPVVNAGDGTGEHPTQSLLDLYTIQSELGLRGGPSHDMTSRPLTVTFVGDLKNGRTVHSLAPLLGRWFADITLVYVAPTSLAMPVAITNNIAAIYGQHAVGGETSNFGVKQVFDKTLDEAIPTTDVLYVTRIQRERFASEEEYQEVANTYCVDAALMQKAKQGMIVMHPLPRLNEIATEVDSDPRAAYFRQVENGMYVRMAILDLLLRGDGK